MQAVMKKDLLQWRFQSWVRVLSCGVFMGVLGAMPAHSQQVGDVEFVRGVGFAQTTGQGARVLSKGVALKEGDRLTTSEGATAIIKLQVHPYDRAPQL